MENDIELIDRKFVKCPDGTITYVVGFDTDIQKEFVFINGAKCFVDGPDYEPSSYKKYLDFICPTNLSA